VVLCSSIPKRELPDVLASISEVSRGQLGTIVVTLPDTPIRTTDKIITLNSPAGPHEFVELVRRAMSTN